MTAQIDDECFYRDEAYSIAGINGEGLFQPHQHGLTPISPSSACWRGFYCTYEIDDRLLRLKTLNIGVSLGEGPALGLFGVLPTYPNEEGLANHSNVAAFTAFSTCGLVYNDIGRIMPFTGGLLLGTDFITELYVHMGFHPGWKYRKVHELIFKNGEVVQEADRSKEAEELRRRLGDRLLRPESRTRRSDTALWVDQCFSRKYALDMEGFEKIQKELEQAQTQADAPRLEALKMANDLAQELAAALALEGLTCPHCHTHTDKIRFVDKRPEGNSFFICRLCGRSFGPEQVVG